MSAKPFINTNVLVYSFDHSDADKRGRARELLYGGDDWVISWQVVQEFCNVALHRFARPMMIDDLSDFLRLVLIPHCRIMPTAQLYEQALQINAQTKYRFYDSLIVASALIAGADVLYSEDLQADRMIGNLRIVNPFVRR